MWWATVEKRIVLILPKQPPPMTHPTLLERFKCEFENEDNKRNWGTFLNS
jgi:hypothetical protein